MLPAKLEIMKQRFLRHDDQEEYQKLDILGFKGFKYLSQKRGWNGSIATTPFEILVFNVYLAFLR